MANQIQIVLVLVAFCLFRRARAEARSRRLKRLHMFFFLGDNVDFVL